MRWSALEEPLLEPPPLVVQAALGWQGSREAPRLLGLARLGMLERAWLASSLPFGERLASMGWREADPLCPA